MTTLKQFIKSVRASKTAADERAIIQKESAAIRASFREESNNHYHRRNNLSKLRKLMVYSGSFLEIIDMFYKFICIYLENVLILGKLNVLDY